MDGRIVKIIITDDSLVADTKLSNGYMLICPENDVNYKKTINTALVNENNIIVFTDNIDNIVSEISPTIKFFRGDLEILREGSIIMD